MIQAARSGKKNLLEGSKAGTTSKETELKLTGVARSSLEELLDDYLDYLRSRDLRLWDKESKEARYVRRLGRKTPQTYEHYREFVDSRSPEVIANIAICIIHQQLSDRPATLAVGKRFPGARRFARANDPDETLYQEQTMARLPKPEKSVILRYVSQLSSRERSAVVSNLFAHSFNLLRRHLTGVSSEAFPDVGKNGSDALCSLFFVARQLIPDRAHHAIAVGLPFDRDGAD